MVRRLLPPLLALLAGCASSPPAIAPAAPVTVKVPILRPLPCDPPRLGRPALPIAGLRAGSAPADTVRAYAATVAILKGAVAERDAVIAGCAAPRSGAALANAAAPIAPPAGGTPSARRN